MLFIDGNNAAAARRPWHPHSLDWRRRLLVDVARLTHRWESCADVVFDGFAPPGFNGVEAAVRAWFSGRRAADDRIVELVEDTAREEAIVATCDGGLARRALALGARVVSTATLRTALDRVGSSGFAFGWPRSPLLDGPSALLAMQRARDQRPAA